MVFHVILKRLYLCVMAIAEWFMGNFDNICILYNDIVSEFSDFWLCWAPSVPAIGLLLSNCVGTKLKSHLFLKSHVKRIDPPKREYEWGPLRTERKEGNHTPFVFLNQSVENKIFCVFKWSFGRNRDLNQKKNVETQMLRMDLQNKIIFVRFHDLWCRVCSKRLHVWLSGREALLCDPLFLHPPYRNLD